MDIDELRKTSLRMAGAVAELKPRHAFSSLAASVGKAPRIILLKGLRGTGKTTLLLQLLMKHKDDAFYVSMSDPRAEKTTIYELGKRLFELGYRILIFDEIHTIPGWRNHIKSLHDEFAEAHLIASGSAPLAFEPERREREIHLNPMLYSEYLYLKHGISFDFNEWWDSKKAMEFVASNPILERESERYLQTGGFPLFRMELADARQAIYNVVRESVEKDAIAISKLSVEKVHAMEKLLFLLATSKPGELNANSLASSLGVSRTVVNEIIKVLAAMDIIRVMLPHGRGHKLVRGEPKLLFYHPNLRVAVCDALGIPPELGALREDLAIFAFAELDWKASTIKGLKKSPDYLIEKGGEVMTVEIGGQWKKFTQLAGFRNPVLVGPDCLTSLIAQKSAKMG